MKIVYFIDHLRSDGGTQRVLGQLARGLAERGHVQSVVSMNSNQDLQLSNELQGGGVDVRAVGTRNWLNGKGPVSLTKWLRAEQFDVAVTMLYFADLVGRPLARAVGIPRVISSLRARNIHYSRLARAMTRASMSRADKIVLNSRSVQEFAVAVEGVHPEQIVIIPNGICSALYGKPIGKEALRREWNLPRDARVIASVGRLTRQKGLDILIRSLAKLPSRCVYLVLIGNGEEKAELRALAAEFQVQDHVVFAGFRNDVPHLLGAFDLYAHPARFEGMPNAVMQAMAAGCPIVATAVDGTTELLRDGTDGWLVPPDDVDALGAAMQEALDNPSLAQARGQSAQERAVTHFSETAMVDAWERVLRG